MFEKFDRRPFVVRLWRSYCGWRAIFDRREAFRAAWFMTWTSRT